MPRCEQIQNELSAYLDGELPQQDKADIGAHLQGCDACQAVLADLKRVQDALADLPKLPAPDALPDRIRLALGQSAASSAPRDALTAVPWRKSLGTAFVGMAALLMIGVLVFAVLPRMNQRYEHSNVAVLPAGSPTAPFAPRANAAKDAPSNDSAEERKSRPEANPPHAPAIAAEKNATDRGAGGGAAQAEMEARNQSHSPENAVNGAATAPAAGPMVSGAPGAAGSNEDSEFSERLGGGKSRAREIKGASLGQLNQSAPGAKHLPKEAAAEGKPGSNIGSDPAPAPGRNGAGALLVRRQRAAETNAMKDKLSMPEPDSSAAAPKAKDEKASAPGSDAAPALKRLPQPAQDEEAATVALRGIDRESALEQLRALARKFGARIVTDTVVKRRDNSSQNQENAAIGEASVWRVRVPVEQREEFIAAIRRAQIDPEQAVDKNQSVPAQNAEPNERSAEGLANANKHTVEDVRDELKPQAVRTENAMEEITIAFEQLPGPVTKDGKSEKAETSDKPREKSAGQ